MLLWNYTCGIIGILKFRIKELVYINKQTRAVDTDTYKIIISTIRSGFKYKDVYYKSNQRIATILVLEYNLGLRVGDILKLTMDSIVRDGNRYRLNIYEQKTGKYRNFTVLNEVYQFVEIMHMKIK